MDILLKIGEAKERGTEKHYCLVNFGALLARRESGIIGTTRLEFHSSIVL